MRWLLTMALAATLAGPARLAAQHPDSAQVARREVRAAGNALRRGDSTAALANLQHAVGAWPAQGAYRLALANLAAQRGRAALALTALDTLVRLGYGWSDDEPAAGLLANAAGYSAIARRMKAATAPLLRSRVLATLPDTMLHPEGIAWDGEGRRWLVSSVRQRKVVAVDTNGRMTEFLAPGQDGLDGVFGLAVDSTAGLLWLASRALPNQEGYTAADSGRSALFAFDLASGALRRRVDGRGANLGDLTLAPDGSVYLSDDAGRAIHRLLPGGVELEPVTRDQPLLRSPQGLAIAPDGKRLYVADWAHGLMVVDLATGQVRPLPLDGLGTLLGLDGLVFIGPGRLAAMQNGIAPPRVVGLILDPAGERVTRLEVLDRHLPLATEPTLGVVAGGALVYIANSPWANYTEEGQPLPGAAWPKPVVLRLGL